MKLDFKTWFETATSTSSVASFARPIGSMVVRYPWNVVDPFFKKKKKKINEMPMTSFGVDLAKPNDPKDISKDVSDTGWLNVTDRSIIKNVLKDKVERILKKSPYNWNLIFMDNYFPKKLDEYIAKNKIIIPGHITYVKTSSTGHPLTEWMTLHTIGHALHKSIPEYNKFISYLDELSEEINRIQGFPFRNNVLPLSQLFSFNSAAATQMVYRRVGSEKQRKRANLDMILDLEEMAHEIVALYLYKGQVKLELNSLGEVRLHKTLNHPEIIQGRENKLLQLIQEVEPEINSMIDSILKEAVGKVIVD